jgi:hypothetical protein
VPTGFQVTSSLHVPRRPLRNVVGFRAEGVGDVECSRTWTGLSGHVRAGGNSRTLSVSADFPGPESSAVHPVDGDGQTRDSGLGVTHPPHMSSFRTVVFPDGLNVRDR